MSSVETERQRPPIGVSRRKFLALAGGGAGFILNACLPKEQPHISELLSFLELVSKKGGYLYLEPTDQTIGSIDENGQKLSFPKDPTINRYYSLGLSPKGDQLALVFSKKEDKNHAYLRLVDLTKRKVVDFRENVDIVGNEEPKNPNLWTPRWSPEQSLIFSPAHQAVWETKAGKTVIEDINAEVAHSVLPEKMSPANNEIITWNKTKGNGVFISGPQKDIQLELPSRFPETAAWVNNGELIIMQTGDNPVKYNYFDRLGKLVKGKEIILDQKLSLELSLNSIVFSPDGKYLAAMSYSFGDFYVQDLNSGKGIMLPLFSKQLPHEFLHKGKQNVPNSITWFKNGRVFILLPSVWQKTKEKKPTNPQGAILSLEEIFHGGIDLIQGHIGSGMLVELEGLDPSMGILIPNIDDVYRRGKMVIEGLDLDWKNQNTIVVDFKTGKTQNLGRANGVVLSPKAQPVAPQVIVRKEEEKAKETMPTMGDIIRIGDAYFYLNNGKKYRIDLKTFTERTGFEKTPIPVSESFAKNIPEGQIPKEDFVLDWTGSLKANRSKMGGGRKTLWFPGLFTSAKGGPAPIVSVDQTFLSLRGVSEEMGRGDLDHLFYTYFKGYKEAAKRGWVKFIDEDTKQSLWTSVDLCSQQIKEIKGNFPLESIDIVGHSLGGVVALLGAAEHLDAVNSIVCIASPLTGMPHDFKTELALKRAPAFFGEVLEDLYGIWTSKEYKRKPEEILREINRRKIIFLPLFSMNDMITSYQDYIFEGATKTLGNERLELVFPMGGGILDLTSGHGEPLDHPRVADYMLRAQGLGRLS